MMYMHTASCVFRTIHIVNPSLAEHDMHCLSKQRRSDQFASEKANRSGSALFVIKYVNFYKKKPGSSNLIGWKLEVARRF